MRFILALSLLLLLSPLISAASLSDFLSPYLLPGERTVGEDFSTGGSNYVLVRIGGKPSFLLTEDNGEYSFVSGAWQIREILSSKLVDEFALTESLDTSLQLMHEFNNSREAGEAECRRQTGTDRLPCIDKDSCIVACRSVPNCQTALSYNIDSINAIRDWLSLVSMLNLRVAEAAQANQDAASALSSSFEADPLDALLLAEYDVHGLAHNVSANRLFDCTKGSCFCAYTYNQTPLHRAIEITSLMRSNLTALQALPALSSSIANSTLQRTSIRDDAERYALVLSEAKSGLASLDAEVGNSLVFIRDEGLSEGLTKLRANLTALDATIAQKNYTRAAALASAFTMQLDVLRARTEANTGDYYLFLDLRLNISRTLDLLGQMRLDAEGQAQLADLEERYASSEIITPLSRSLADSTKTELLDQQAKASSLFTKAERTRIEAEVAVMRAKIFNLTILASNNEQKIDFAPLMQELDDVGSAIQRDDLPAAGSKADEAQSRILEVERNLLLKIDLIGDAKAAVASAQLEVDAASSVHFAIVQPDLREANAALENARSLMYSDPAAASAEAMRARELARGEVDGAHSSDQLATIAAVLLGIILIAGLIYWMYNKEEQ